MEKGCGVGLSVYVAGVGSTAALTNCTIAGSLQGVHVEQGEAFNGEKLECTGKDWQAGGVSGTGSALPLKSSTLRDEYASSELRVSHQLLEGPGMGIMGNMQSVLSIVGTTITGFSHALLAADVHVSKKQCILQDSFHHGRVCFVTLSAEFVACKFTRVRSICLASC